MTSTKYIGMDVHKESEGARSLSVLERVGSSSSSCFPGIRSGRNAFQSAASVYSATGEESPTLSRRKGLGTLVSLRPGYLKKWYPPIVISGQD
jgi:hypothetical protein